MPQVPQRDFPLQDLKLDPYGAYQTGQTNALANALQEFKRQSESARAPYYGQLAALEPQQKYAELQEALAKPDLYKAQAQYYRTGGSAGGVGQKEQMTLHNNVQMDNPSLNPDQIREAATVYARGGDTLSDGTKLAPMSFDTQQSLNRVIKYGTTSPLITQGVQANQAEAEIDTLDKYAQEGIAPYGTEILGYSPDQIVDTFRNDEQSQKKLGKFIASQGLQFEIAQQRIKLANGQPGVTSTQELINMSKQAINAKYPRLSATARKEANDYMNEALKAGKNARQSVGINPSQLHSSVAKNLKRNSTGEEEGLIKYGRDANGRPVRLN